MSKKLKIKLLPNGEIQMETHGVKGKKCLEYVDLLKKMVNIQVLDTQLTDEYYETDTETTTEQENRIRLD